MAASAAEVKGMMHLPGDDASVRPKHPGVVGAEHGDRSPVAARLRDLRTRRGVTQRELAASTGIVERTVARAEAHGAVAFDTILKLAGFYAVSIDYIAHGSEPSAPTAFDDASEALPISEQALRAMRGAHRLDPETTERLRARIVSVQFPTGARLSTAVSFLEDELSAIQARRSEAKSELTRREPKRRGRSTSRRNRRLGSRSARAR